MEHFRQTAWLAEESLSTLGYFWQVTLPLVVAALVALIFQLMRVRSGFRFTRGHLLLLSPLAVSVLILFWGAVMEHPGNSGNPAPDWPTYVMFALLALQLLFSVWLVWKMKGLRWLAVFSAALQMWFSFACSFVAGMSVTGDWL